MTISAENNVALALIIIISHGQKLSVSDILCVELKHRFIAWLFASLLLHVFSIPRVL